MPKVGGMRFPYTRQGVTEAKSRSRVIGKPVEVEENYMGGGKVHMPKYQYGGRVPGGRPLGLGSRRARPGMRPGARPMSGARPGMRPQAGGRGTNPILQALASRFKKGGKVKK